MGTATPTIDLPRSKVRVTTPDKETGEIIERVIPAKDFRPKLPSAPKVDERRITLVQRGDTIGPTGRSVVYMASHREREIAYWAAFANILTPVERRALAKGDAASVLRPLPPAWEVGDRMFVAANMEAEVIEATESPRGYGTVFKVHDYRVMYLKRGVLGSGPAKSDEDGYAPVLTPTEKARASQESAYTGSASQAIDEAGAVMDEEALRRIHSEKSAADTITQGKGRVQVTEGRLLRRLAEARAKNRSSTVRHLERELGRLRAKHAAA